VDRAQNGDSPAERTGLISRADRAYLSGQLSAHVMEELLGVLRELPTEVRGRLVTEVRVEAESFGDRALGLALARVAHDSHGCARGSGS